MVIRVPRFIPVWIYLVFFAYSAREQALLVFSVRRHGEDISAENFITEINTIYDKSIIV